MQGQLNPEPREVQDGARKLTPPLNHKPKTTTVSILAFVTSRFSNPRGVRARKRGMGPKRPTEDGTPLIEKLRV